MCPGTVEAEWQYLESLFLADLLPREDAVRLGCKGVLTVADLIRTTVSAEQVNQTPIEEFAIPTQALRRLVAKGCTTIGSTDELTEEMIRLYMPGLGERAITAINEARAQVGKKPLKKYG
jgi:hypothetical protein